MRTSIRWHECLNTAAVYRYPDFEYIDRLCRSNTGEDRLRFVQRRELDRYHGRLQEVVIPYQTYWRTAFAIERVFTPRHGSNLVKLEIQRRDLGSSLPVEVPDLSYCTATLQIIRLKDCTLAWRSRPQPIYQCLRELTLDDCAIDRRAALPTTLKILKVKGYVVPNSWRNITLPILHTLEVRGRSLNDRQTWARILALQSVHHRIAGSIPPTFSLILDYAPAPLRQLDGHLLSRCSGLEELELGGRVSMTVGFLETVVPALAAPLTSLSLYRAEGKIRRRTVEQSLGTMMALARAGIQLRLYSQPVLVSAVVGIDGLDESQVSVMTEMDELLAYVPEY